MNVAIELNNVGKQFEGEWIFKSVSLHFSNAFVYHIAGGNGSGKSTFLKLLSAYSSPSKGEIVFTINHQTVSGAELFSKLSWCAPYTDVYSNLSLGELFDFYKANKPLNCQNVSEFAQISYLSDHIHKPLKNFSSGMLQRVKLAFAILAKSDILFLDEPCSNLDEKGVLWYQNLLQQHLQNRLVIIASNNHQSEIFCCNKMVNIEAFKLPS